MPRILGIDFGDRRFGLALSDPSGMLASAHLVVEGEEGLRKELSRLFAEEEVERIVLGLPVNMDGTLGPKAKQVLAFKERLEVEWKKPVDTWDERLTTVQAQRSLREGGLSRGQRSARVDKVAAQILLQSYLDNRRVSSGGGE